jgi:hypothetical protein
MLQKTLFHFSSTPFTTTNHFQDTVLNSHTWGLNKTEHAPKDCKKDAVSDMEKHLLISKKDL